MIYFLRYLVRLINIIKGGKTMEEQDRPKRPSEWAKQESKKPKKKTLEDGKDKFDKNGNLFIRLTIDDSALVVRADGSIELISHDLENSDDGYVGDVEDLNKTFSLVLALASALEDEDLYNRIFHNLNMTLMKKWDNMPDDIKKEIVEKKRKLEKDRNPQEEMEKKQRIEEFRKRMNKYKETFLDDLDAEKERLRKDIQDEEDFHRRYGRDFGAEHEYPDHLMPEDMDHFMGGPGGGMESRPRKKIKKKKASLDGLRGVDWNPYDETLITKKGKWRLDYPPDDEEE